MSQYTQPPQPQQPYAPPHAPGTRPARNGLGIAALVLGIIGTLSGLVPLLFWLAGILGLIALILGLSGRGRVKRGEATNKGVTTFGAVLGLVALILSVVGAVIMFKAVDDVVKDIDKELSGSSASAKPGGGSEDSPKDSGQGEEKDSGKGGADSGTLEGRDTAAYDDGLEVTVSNAAAYTPDAYAAGHTKGNRAYKVSVVIENKTKKKYDSVLASVDARAGADGVNAEQIFDGTVGEGFTGTVLPGKKVTVQYAFDAPADAKNLTVEVSPGFDWDASQWDLKL
ncbi:DUF4352 domain-containing protein [Streptomyces halstedii]|uniref:DUF4352 domain-containing protein n=1 Tax=Streptomyces TaxID=1883 RepID=UPI000805D28F|nr:MULTISPECIES: DUF4352 domain-containing protein [unclassified Streptomyces]MYQ52638.1 DUF4352 domain-containing protein [Streptomyces sp. SID4941]MYR72429.1 DUF4352 domain-containing protein [Streptomyces sp. SID4925]SBU91004.1 Predicted membrane protein [Streptomyces sp. OspMP-M45]SCD87140.1 protein of unknown function [Streptomyces sp. PalvLS-984]SCE29678.1 protein of unknown function [Streptomyces sp. PpalLS-921]